jgi:hypothetical protein
MDGIVTDNKQPGTGWQGDAVLRAACSIFDQSLFLRRTLSKRYPPAASPRGDFIAGGRPFGLRQNWGFRPFYSTWQVRASTLTGAFRLICSAWAPRDKSHSLAVRTNLLNTLRRMGMAETNLARLERPDR